MSRFRFLAPHRPLLYVLSAVGLFGVNGVFLYYAFLHPDVLAAANANPVSLVFIVEAFGLMGFGGWTIRRAGLSRPGWLAFIVMSIAGSLAFSVPAFLLLHLRKGEKGARASETGRSREEMTAG